MAFWHQGSTRLAGWAMICAPLSANVRADSWEEPIKTNHRTDDDTLVAKHGKAAISGLEQIFFFVEEMCFSIKI